MSIKRSLSNESFLNIWRKRSTRRFLQSGNTFEATYKVTYSLSVGLRHLLRRLDFVYKKPKAIPGKADKAEQEKFLRMIEAKLAENSRKTAVYYADGTHPQHNTHCAHGWIKKGWNK